jgi:hypothetical protein
MAHDARYNVSAVAVAVATGKNNDSKMHDSLSAIHQQDKASRSCNSAEQSAGQRNSHPDHCLGLVSHVPHCTYHMNQTDKAQGTTSSAK